MENAIKAITQKTMGYRRASEQFNVPKTTLKRRVKGENTRAVGPTKVILIN